MTEWKKVKLGEISSNIQTGPFGSQLHQSDYSEQGTPVVMPKDIINGCIVEDSIARVEQEHVDRLERHKTQIGDILYARRGDVGKCAFTKVGQQGWLCGTGCLKVTINSAIANPKYVFFQLQKPETIGWVEKNAIGATMLNLNTTILSNVPLELPTLRIQDRVVEILSRYDTLIENYQKQIKLLEEAAQRLYKEWFVDLRFPGHENVEVVDGVPVEWEKKKVIDFATIKSGYAFKSKDWQCNGCPVVKIKDIQTSFVEENNLDCVSNEVAKKALIYKLQKGDLVIAMTGATIGKLGIIANDGLYTNQRVGKFFFKNRAFIPFLYCYFKLKSTLEKTIQLSSSSSAQPNISGSQLESYTISCSINLVKKFCSKVDDSYKEMILLKSQIRHLTEARDRLLPKLMSGEIAV